MPVLSYFGHFAAIAVLAAARPQASLAVFADTHGVEVESLSVTHLSYVVFANVHAADALGSSSAKNR